MQNNPFDATNGHSQPSNGHSQLSSSGSLTVQIPRLKDLGAIKYFILDIRDRHGEIWWDIRYLHVPRVNHLVTSNTWKGTSSWLTSTMMNMWATRMAESKHVHSGDRRCLIYTWWQHMDLLDEGPENGHDFLIKMFDAKEEWVASWSSGLAPGLLPLWFWFESEHRCPLCNSRSCWTQSSWECRMKSCRC